MSYTHFGSSPTMVEAYREVRNAISRYMDESEDLMTPDDLRWDDVWIDYITWATAMGLTDIHAAEYERKMSLTNKNDIRSRVITTLHDVMAVHIRKALEALKKGTQNSKETLKWRRDLKLQLLQLWQDSGLERERAVELTKKEVLEGDLPGTPMPQGGYGDDEGEDTEVEGSRKGKGKAKDKGKGKGWEVVKSKEELEREKREKREREVWGPLGRPKSREERDREREADIYRQAAVREKARAEAQRKRDIEVWGMERAARAAALGLTRMSEDTLGMTRLREDTDPEARGMLGDLDQLSEEED